MNLTWLFDPKLVRTWTVVTILLIHPDTEQSMFLLVIQLFILDGHWNANLPFSSRNYFPLDQNARHIQVIKLHQRNCNKTEVKRLGGWGLKLTSTCCSYYLNSPIHLYRARQHSPIIILINCKESHSYHKLTFLKMLAIIFTAIVLNTIELPKTTLTPVFNDLFYSFLVLELWGRVTQFLVWPLTYWTHMHVSITCKQVIIRYC